MTPRDIQAHVQERDAGGGLAGLDLQGDRGGAAGGTTVANAPAGSRLSAGRPGLPGREA